MNAGHEVVCYLVLLNKNKQNKQTAYADIVKLSEKVSYFASINLETMTGPEIDVLLLTDMTK